MKRRLTHVAPGYARFAASLERFTHETARTMPGFNLGQIREKNPCRWGRGGARYVAGRVMLGVMLLLLSMES